MKIRRLSDGERKLMEILWKNGGALTSNELFLLAGDDSWSENHIFKLLRKLEKDEFLKVCGVTRAGRRYTRQFIPCISKEEYVSNLLELEAVSPSTLARIALAFTKKGFFKKAPVDREKLIAELEAMIEQYRNEPEPEPEPEAEKRRSE